MQRDPATKDPLSLPTRPGQGFRGRVHRAVILTAAACVTCFVFAIISRLIRESLDCVSLLGDMHRSVCSNEAVRQPQFDCCAGVGSSSWRSHQCLVVNVERQGGIGAEPPCFIGKKF